VNSPRRGWLLLWLLSVATPTAVTALLLLRVSVEPNVALGVFLVLCLLWASLFVRHRGDAARWGSLPGSRSRAGSVVLWTGIAFTINCILIAPVLGAWLRYPHP
jgi:hypothetical protein